MEDGHTNYYGDEGFGLVSTPKYDTLIISNTSNPERFKKDLLHHQRGGSDYFQFCRQCATSGIEKWVVSLQAMTCTYFDKVSAEVLVEAIPQ